MIPFGRYPTRSLSSLGAEAALLALDDAGLSILDIQALYCGNLMEAHLMVGQRILREIGQTGVPVVNTANACATGATAAPGCGTVSLFNNGFNASAGRDTETALQAGLGCDDRRTIVGGRWEHDFDNQTTWRTQFVFDDRNMQAGLARLLERVSDPRPALREIGERMVASTIHNFETETAPDGTKWAPLSEKYRDGDEYRPSH